MDMVPCACPLSCDDLLTRKKNIRSFGTRTIYYKDILLHCYMPGLIASINKGD